MKKSTIFLQIVVVLVGVLALTLMIRLPLTEGRAVDLDLISVYADPFLIYVYFSSIAFFAALYQAFKLLGYVRQGEVFSSSSVKALRVIKYCAITLGVLIILAGTYIRIFHAADDDPAGFLALCIITTLISITVATLASMFEQIVQDATDVRSEKN